MSKAGRKGNGFEANIETYGKQVKFHCLRKFLYTRLQAKNRDIAKVITAKKVSASDLTYIPNLDAECLRVFKEIALRKQET